MAEYKIIKVDNLNWKVTRTAPTEDRKTGETKLVTRDIGFWTRLDKAALAAYEMSLKDETGAKHMAELSVIQKITRRSREAVELAVKESIEQEG